MRAHSTLGERVLFKALKTLDIDARFRRQHILFPFIVDFYCVPYRLVVEVDGGSHIGREAADTKRDARLMHEHGVRVLRFTEEEAVEQTTHVLAEIQRVIAES